MKKPQPGLPETGDIVAGKYRVVRRIAEGGMGVVVEALHIQLEERVAIKFLRPDALGEGVGVDVMARFLREARAALRIRNEHVVRVYDASVLENEVPYIVMELLEGEDLEHTLQRQGAFPIADVVDYVLQAAEGLAEAHALGIIHRDLKPANLFLAASTSGVPILKVLDFGISKDATVSGATLSLTSAHAVLGSPIYMSPEQMRATRDADARSDIWALGVILYELLTGQPPFGGETMSQVCSSILEDTPLPPSRRRGQIPLAIDKAVIKCLEKRPDDRFQDVAGLAEALAPFGTDIGAEAASRTARAMRRLSGNSPAPRMASPSLAALATTNRGDENPTQAMPTMPATAMGSKRRSFLLGVGWAVGVALLVSGGLVAARKASSRTTHATSAAVQAPAPPPESTEAHAAPVAAAPAPEAVPPPDTTAAMPPGPTTAPAPPTPPRTPTVPRTKAVAALAPPGPPPTVPAASSPEPPAATKPVTWDERK